MYTRSYYGCDAVISIAILNIRRELTSTCVFAILSSEHGTAAPQCYLTLGLLHLSSDRIVI